MNETLESVARAIFKSWFVDFKPVRSKTEGRDTGLPKHIADLFPNSFVDSELGEIPSGWEMRGLDKIAVFLNGLALQKYPPKDGSSLPVIKSLSLGRAIQTEQIKQALILILITLLLMVMSFFHGQVRRSAFFGLEAQEH